MKPALLYESEIWMKSKPSTGVSLLIEMHQGDRQVSRSHPTKGPLSTVHTVCHNKNGFAGLWDLKKV